MRGQPGGADSAPAPGEGPPLKFVHAADLHLDSPLRGLARYEGAPTERIRGATRRALENLVELCVDEEAELLLLAGDLYDGDWNDYSTGLFLHKQMVRLREAGVRVVMIRGNHDAASRITRRLDLPDNVVELRTASPQTWTDEALGVAVHGQGFATRAVTEDLAAAYPERRAGLLNVGLLHTSLTGREGHASYAPTSVDVLVARGYDYWALGHVHAREVVSEDPWIVYPGNLQGRHARETGAKGATVVTVRDGRVVAVEPRTLDVVRWARVEVAASERARADELYDEVGAALGREVERAEGRLCAARVRLSGATDAHAALHADPVACEAAVHAAALEQGSDAVWVERVEIATRAPLDLEVLRERDDPVGRLARTLSEIRDDEDALRALHTELAELDRRLPAELRTGDDALRLDDVELLRAAIVDVEQVLLPELLRGADA